MVSTRSLQHYRAQLLTQLHYRTRFYNFIPCTVIPCHGAPLLAHTFPDPFFSLLYYALVRPIFIPYLHGSPPSSPAPWCATYLWFLMVVSAIVAYYPYYSDSILDTDVAKGWDGFQLGKGQGGFTVLRRGGARPGVDWLFSVSKRCVISCARQLISSFEPSTSRLLIHTRRSSIYLLPGLLILLCCVQRASSGMAGWSACRPTPLPPRTGCCCG